MAVKTGLDESETVTTKVLVPAAVGVPEITPEVGGKPVGSDPLIPTKYRAQYLR